MKSEDEKLKELATAIHYRICRAINHGDGELECNFYDDENWTDFDKERYLCTAIRISNTVGVDVALMVVDNLFA